MKNLLLLVSSFIGAVFFCVLLFEVVGNVSYLLWKNGFDNGGWLGKITIKSDNNILMWEYKPYGNLKSFYEFDKYGFRNLDIDYKDDSNNLYKIAFIGDSVTFGLNVKINDTIQKLFDKKINTLDLKKIKSINFGVDSYNTIQIEENLKTKVSKLKFDRIIYVMCLNDFDSIGEDEATGEKGKYFNKPKSFLFVKILKAYRSLLRIDYHSYHFEKNKRKVFLSIESMKNFSDKLGVKFNVVIVPVFFLEKSSFNDYPLEYIHKETSELLYSQQISYLDLLPFFKATNLPPQHFALDLWHPSPIGNDFIATTLVNILKEDLN